MIAPNPLPWGDDGQVRAWLNQVPQSAHADVGAIIAVAVIAVALIVAIIVWYRRRPPGPPPPTHPVWGNPKVGRSVPTADLVADLPQSQAGRP